MDTITLFNEILAEVGNGENGFTAAECLAVCLMGTMDAANVLFGAEQARLLTALAEGATYNLLAQIKDAREASGTEV